MVSRPCKNPPRFANDPDKLGDFKQNILAPSNASPLDALILDIPVPAPTPAKYTKEAF